MCLNCSFLTKDARDFTDIQHVFFVDLANGYFVKANMLSSLALGARKVFFSMSIVIPR